jgi:hypothetical protein
MARASWYSKCPVDKFTSGYRPHRLDNNAIREWASSRLRKGSKNRLLQRLAEGEREVLSALAALRALPTVAKVSRAIANAEEHLAWLRLIRSELRHQHCGRPAARQRE